MHWPSLSESFSAKGLPTRIPSILFQPELIPSEYKEKHNITKMRGHLEYHWLRIYAFLAPSPLFRLQMKRACSLFNNVERLIANYPKDSKCSPLMPLLWTSFPHPKYATLQSLVYHLEDMHVNNSAKKWMECTVVDCLSVAMDVRVNNEYKGLHGCDSSYLSLDDTSDANSDASNYANYANYASSDDDNILDDRMTTYAHGSIVQIHANKLCDVLFQDGWYERNISCQKIQVQNPNPLHHVPVPAIIFVHHRVQEYVQAKEQNCRGTDHVNIGSLVTIVGGGSDETVFHGPAQMLVDVGKRHGVFANNGERIDVVYSTYYDHEPSPKVFQGLGDWYYEWHYSWYCPYFEYYYYDEYYDYHVVVDDYEPECREVEYYDYHLGYCRVEPECREVEHVHTVYNIQGKVIYDENMPSRSHVRKANRNETWWC